MWFFYQGSAPACERNQETLTRPFKKHLEIPTWGGKENKTNNPTFQHGSCGNGTENLCFFCGSRAKKKGFVCSKREQECLGAKENSPIFNPAAPRDQHLLMFLEKKSHGLMDNKWAANSSSWQRKRNILLHLSVWAAAHRQELSTALLTTESRNLGMKWGRKVSQSTNNEVDPHWAKNCSSGGVGYFCPCSLVGCFNNLFLILFIHLWVGQSSWNPGSSKQRGEMGSSPDSALQEKSLFKKNLFKKNSSLFFSSSSVSHCL